MQWKFGQVSGAINTALLLVPMNGDVPEQTILWRILDLAQALLAAIPAFRPPRAGVQAERGMRGKAGERGASRIDVYPYVVGGLRTTRHMRATKAECGASHSKEHVDEARGDSGNKQPDSHKRTSLQWGQSTPLTKS
jgi:hypothetical protein